MIRSVKDVDAKFYKVIDIETGKWIRQVQWADDISGIYHQIRMNDNGELVYDINNKPIIDIKKGKIKFVDLRLDKNI